MGVTITWTNGSNKKDPVPSTSAIVKLPRGPYREIAKRWWKLSDEQMVGMHVHHRIPQARAGTDWEGNLYVCSPWFHLNVWHGWDNVEGVRNIPYDGRPGGLAMRGRKMSEEHKRKIRESCRKAAAKRTYTDEQRQKLREAGSRGGKAPRVMKK